MLNNYVWNIYLESGGRNLVTFFENNLTFIFTKEYPEKIKTLHKYYCVDNNIINETYEDLIELQKIIVNDDTEEEVLTDNDDIDYSSNLNYEDFILLLEEFLDEIAEANNINDDKELFIMFTDYMSFYTTTFAIYSPDLFIPYYYKYNFNVLDKIFKEFGIEMPTIPLKKDYKERIYIYADICYKLYVFRQKNNLSYFELCAFLYDFAPKYIGGIDSYIIKNLPDPKGAFLIGSSSDDRFLSYNESSYTIWQCNNDTRPGDMILLYLTYPVSSIDSIWRSVSAGFKDPFFFYYNCTYMGNPVKIDRISLSALKEDPKLNTLSIVKRNMQGVNGYELSPSIYNYIVDMCNVTVNKFEILNFKTDDYIHVEKDVEDKIIKPFLKRIGYSEGDYTQQLTISVGNHNTLLIPDFVLKPKVQNGYYSAFAVIEAKLDIKNSNDLQNARIQVRSYAKQLGAKYALIADVNSLRVMESKDDYERMIFCKKWNSIYDIDAFQIIEKLLSR